MDCDFCNEQASIETIYNHIYGVESRQIYETAHFCLVPCLGQLREGHFLIYSKAHFHSTGELDSDQAKELKAMIYKVTKYIKKEYHMETVCFEHGVLGDDGRNGGCGISHMHIHLLPCTASEFDLLLKAVIQDTGNVLASVNSISDTKILVDNKKTYVFLSKVENQYKDDSYIITNQTNFFESQYMRKKLAEIFKKDIWNWRDINYPEKDFLNTFVKAKRFFTL